MSVEVELIIIFGILFLPLIAQILVTTSFKKYSKVTNKKNITGAEVARMILDNHNLSNIYVVQTGGNLTDHYDPKRKVIRLSEDVYEQSSVAALAIAAHECGHAIQDKEGYSFMRFRSMIYPIVNVATSLSYIIIVIGFIAQLMDLVYLGIIFTSMGLLFQIITLPVEFNASNRAKKELERMDIVESEEASGVNSVLTSAALTYVAGVLASALQIIRLILIANDRQR